MDAGDSMWDSLDELEDYADSDSDYEATIKTTKRRKRAVPGPQPPKRPRRKSALRVTSSHHNSPIPAPVDPSLQQQQISHGSSRQVSPRRSRGVNERNPGISAEDIYNAVCSGKSAMVTVVDEWLDSYKRSREVGLLVLINFIVRSCGCKGVVSREMLDSMQNAEIISSLTKEFNEDSVNYPLCTPGPTLKRFKAGLCEFATVLVRSCRNSLIYDEYLFPSLLALLTGLSDSQVRAFRHTSTLLAMKLMTGLVEVAVIVSVQLQTTQRQHNMEHSKSSEDRASDRLEELEATLSELQEKREELSSMMNATFRGVFVHRYRDRLTDIRVLCIEDLGLWIKIDPEDFLNDGCLKYVGWTLHDKQSPVRLQCVRALQGLYKEKEFIGRLELFTSRFKERMLSMALDKDSDVAVDVVNLLLLIHQRSEEGLREEECSHIYPLVYASHRGLASAAGAFLYNKYTFILPLQTNEQLSMKLMTGLVEVAVIVSVQLQTTQRQHNMEHSKSSEDRASDRLEELEATLSELQEKREELSSMMNATFRGVFVHRYRDRLTDIRVLCIEDLGLWIKIDPEDFLNDGCLKYVGWTLHDKQSPVRLQCVRALQGLYKEKEFIGRLELFTSRFKERMLSMALDKDSDVAVDVVNLLLLIHQRSEEGLREEECSHIYPLVYASHRGLASAAGAFLYNKLKGLISSDKQENERSDKAAFLQILISFYTQSEFHEHGAYLVDSLWAVASSELRDWETMTTFLLKEAGLTDKEEGALIELMMCAVRQAAQSTSPVGRAQGKKHQSMKDKKIQEQDRRRITTHFIPLLPQLLSKFSADAGKVSRLLKAPLYFNLEMYNSAQWLERHLDLLLSLVCGIVTKHTDATVLEACTHLVCALCSDTYTFSSRAHLAFSQLMDGLTECFNMYLSDLLQGSADDNDMYSAATALKRIAALCGAKDPTGWKLFDPCVELLKSRLESGELDKELMVSALKCAAFHLMWAKVNAVNFKPAESELARLRREVRSFCKVCQTCLSVNQAAVREQAFELLCDLLMLYSKSSVRSEPALQSLVHLPSDLLRSEMAAFLLDYVFTDSEDHELNVEGEEERKIALLQRKRNQLGGYCKLVIYGVLDLSAATDVFKHYSKYFKDFGDIIKETMSRSKLINPVLSAKTVCLSLQQLFSEMLTEEHSRRDLNEIRDLGKRLAMSFGIDLHRVRKPLVALHMDGIRFAFRDPEEGEEPLRNVAFLEILSEFSFKLLQQDRAQMAALLKSECPSAAISWPPVRMYQHSLETRVTSRPREQQEEGGGAVSSHETPAAKRKRTTAQGSVSSATRGSWLESSSLHSSLPTPALTSTIQRQPPKPVTSSKPTAESDISSGLNELESEDEFSPGPQMRKVKPSKRRLLHSTITSLDQQDLNSNLTLLSLIEDEEAEEEEDEIENYDSDLETGYTLPSTRHNSATLMDELFD